MAVEVIEVTRKHIVADANLRSIRPLSPEGEKAVSLSIGTLVLLGLQSVEIASDHLKRCGIVAEWILV